MHLISTFDDFRCDFFVFHFGTDFADYAVFDIAPLNRASDSTVHSHPADGGRGIEVFGAFPVKSVKSVKSVPKMLGNIFVINSFCLLLIAKKNVM